MVKTTVYLDEADAVALRRLAAKSGRSQAEIIREAIAAATAETRERRLGSIGVGSGSGQPIGRNADSIVREELGSRPQR